MGDAESRKSICALTQDCSPKLLCYGTSKRAVAIEVGSLKRRRNVFHFVISVAIFNHNSLRVVSAPSISECPCHSFRVLVNSKLERATTLRCDSIHK
ncbi:hypothetical protein TGAM01_v206747 [Trichoderma gamsii]|uniref:Uncharacterized protein n=1 Tax=Trichoderma gamsii TaxID=398673 RepID=A0A2P4ZJI2_9HYPO|nr:hypothetical protein TGAM01_v206747 [Trichoderma gamsii]PON24415.1 hypothetical protein TGAM01_v206747 [Trichoderma gamsii]